MATDDPGKFVLDLVIPLAIGGDCVSDLALLRAEPGVFGLVASDPAVSRLVTVLAADAPKALAVMASARDAARARAWRLAGERASGHSIDAKRPLLIDARIPPPSRGPHRTGLAGVRGLADMLARVPDPRKVRGIRPIGAMLAVMVCAVSAGARNFREIADRARLNFRPACWV